MDNRQISNYNAIDMELYRSGHNGAHSKCVSPPGHEGSNPSNSAHKPKLMFRLFCVALSGISSIAVFLTKRNHCLRIQITAAAKILLSSC